VRCTWALLIAALLLCVSCFGQDTAPGAAERQTKLVLPRAQPEATPELVVLPRAVHSTIGLGALFSRDGRTLVTWTHEESLVWDLATRRVRSRLPFGGVRAVSADGSMVAVASDAARLAVFDTRMSRLVVECEVPLAGGDGVAFSPDGTLVGHARGLAIDGRPPVKVALVHEVRSGRRVATFASDREAYPGGERRLEDTAPLAAVGFRPDGVLTAAFVAVSPEAVGPFGLVEQPTARTFPAIDTLVGGCFSADGRWLAHIGETREANGLARVVCYLRNTDDWSVAKKVALAEHGTVLACSARHVVLRVPPSSWPLEKQREVCTYLLDLDTGTSVELPTHNQNPYAALSPDGSLLAAGAGITEVATGRALVPTFEVPAHPVCLFVGDERYFVSHSKGGCGVVSRPVGGDRIPGPLPPAYSLQYVYHDSFISAWVGPDGLRVYPIGKGDGRTPGLVTPDQDGFAELSAHWRPGGNSTSFGLGLMDDGTVLACWTRDGGFTIARYAPDKTVTIVTDEQMGQSDRLRMQSGTEAPLSNDAPGMGQPEAPADDLWAWPRFGPGARKLVLFHGAPMAMEVRLGVVIDVPTARVAGAFVLPGAVRGEAYFLADGRTLVVRTYSAVLVPETWHPDYRVVAEWKRVDSYGDVIVLDTTTGQVIGGWPAFLNARVANEFGLAAEDLLLGVVEVSPEGSWVITAYRADRSSGARAPYMANRPSGAYVHALESGDIVGRAPLRDEVGLVSADCRSDGNLLALTYSDGLTTLWDLAPLRAGSEARLLGTLVDWPNGEWATVTPLGYVDCSPGAVESLAWGLGENLYPFEQFAAKYRRPDLVRRALAGEDISAAGALTGADIPPTAAFLAPEYDATIEGETAKVEVEVAGVRPLARVDLLIDGRPIPDELAATAKWEQIGESHGVYTFELPLSQYQRRTRLQAIVHDEEGLQSMPAEVTFTRAGAPPPATVLHALSVGVSAYRNEEWNNLRYADKDAEAFVKVAGEGTQQHVFLNENATASNVRFALEEMKASVTEDDIVAIFLAGHGAVDAAGNYYMLLHDSDVADLENTALPWDDFVSALKSIRAKLVMVFADTCHSGSITGQESVNTLIDRLNRKAGVIVFTASRGDEASIEREDWGHGAFTKALLEGFSGEADTYPKDKQVSLAELRDYVIPRVEELTSGRQHPYLPRLQEFDPARSIANVLPDLK